MSFKSVVNKVGFSLNQNAPEIFLGLSIVTGIGAGVAIGVATYKAVPVITELETNKLLIADKLEEEVEEYTEEIAEKDTKIFQMQAGVKIAKLYAPAVVLGATSVLCALQSHKIVNGRLSAVGAAYSIIDAGFRSYKERVTERFGEEVEYEIQHGIKTETYEATEVNEKGKEKTVIKERKVRDESVIAPFSIRFDRNNINWEDDIDMNENFLIGKQRHINDVLRTKPCVFLNDVYELIGEKELTKAGTAIGWVNDGSTYIDFGMYAGDVIKMLVVEPDGSIILTFNGLVNILEKNILKEK